MSKDFGSLWDESTILEMNNLYRLRDDRIANLILAGQQTMKEQDWDRRGLGTASTLFGLTW
jgi:hypothetical protein